MDKVYKKMVQNSDIGYAFHKTLCHSDDTPYDYEFIEANKAFEVYTGFRAEEIIGQRVEEILPEKIENQSEAMEYLNRIAIKGEKVEYEKYFKTTDRWLKIQAFSPKKYYFVTYFIDITEEKKKEEALKYSQLRYEQLAEKKHLIVWEVDNNGLYTYISPVAEKIFGYSPDEMIGKMYVYDAPYNCEEDYKKTILRAIKKGQILSNFENKFKTKDNRDVWISTNGFPVLDHKGEFLFYRGIDIDITHLKEIEERIRFFSFRDQLTGLYNRRFFEEELKRLDIERNLPLSIIMVDIDGLKLVNDTFGHNAGDLVLQKIAKILKDGCRADEIVSRIGGDEFVILLPKTSLEEANSIIDRITLEIKKRKVEAMNLSISYGVDTKNQVHENIEDVLKKADIRMYNVKNIEKPKLRIRIIEGILEKLFEDIPEEKAHSKATSDLSVAIGKALKLNDLHVEKLKTIGRFHDIGKIAVPKKILLKKEELSQDDWREIKRHSELGYIILSSSNEHSYFAEDILYIHERYDGKGYPEGLKGEEIPLNSRIIGLAAAFDYMVSNRPYRKAMSKDEALQIIAKESGNHFDPEIVRVFLKANLADNYKNR